MVFLYLLLGVIVLSSTLLVFHSWRFGVIACFILLYVEGIVRRLIPGAPPEVILVKDGVLFLTYCSFLANIMLKKQSLWKPPFFFSLLLMTTIPVLQCFNPNAPSVWVRLAGLRSYIWYIPLLWLGYYYPDGEENVFRLSKYLVYSAILIFAVALAQDFLFHTEAPLVRPIDNPYHSWEYEPAGIKQVPSVFDTADRHARFCFMLMLLGIGIVLLTGRQYNNKIILLISTFCAFASVFVSGRRAPFYLSIIALLFFGILILVSRQHSRKVVSFTLTGILLLITAVVVAEFIPSKGVYYEKSISHIPERYLWMTEWTLQNLDAAGWFGFGTGSISQGMGYVPGGEEAIRTVKMTIAAKRGISSSAGTVESGPGKLCWELGAIGLIAFIVAGILIIYHIWQTTFKMRNHNCFSFIAALAIYFSSMVLWFYKGYQIAGDAHTLITSWFFLGAMFQIKDLSLSTVRNPNITILSSEGETRSGQIKQGCRLSY